MRQTSNYSSIQVILLLTLIIRPGDDDDNDDVVVVVVVGVVVDLPSALSLSPRMIPSLARPELRWPA